MKKLIFCLGFILSTFLQANSQVIPNADFEEYYFADLAMGHMHQYARNWYPGNYLNYEQTLYYDKIFTISQDAHSGSKAIRIEDEFIKSGPIILNGARPNYFSGYFKSNLNPGDTAVIFLTYAPYNHDMSQSFVMQKITGNFNSYTSFSLPMEYPAKHDSVFICIKSNINWPVTSLSKDSYLLVDDLSFTNFPLALQSEENTSTSLINYFPNPSNGNVNFRTSKPHTEIVITNSLGEIVFTCSPGLYETEQTDLSHLPKGLYVITAKAGDQIQNLKLILE